MNTNQGLQLVENDPVNSATAADPAGGRPGHEGAGNVLSQILGPRREPGNAERLELLVEEVVDYGIFVLDPQGHVLTWNSGAQNLKGYARDEIVGKHFSIFYPPEAVLAGWPDEELLRARRTGRFEDEGWRLRKDGSRFWAHVVITALHDESGNLTGFAKITRDLTERRMQEERLRASEERLRLLVESVRDYAIFMLDPDGTVRGWNAGAQAIHGYQAPEVMGRHFSIFYPPEERLADKPARELACAAAQGRIEDEGWRVRKDGALFWANVVVTAMRSPEGELIGFAKVTRDMTERKRLEELERSSRRMNEFLATLAHELRNPLAPVRNALTLMQLEPMISPALRNARDIIDRQISHMTRLVDDLLDVGRFNTGKVKLRREPARMDELVSRSIETVRPLIESRKHQLSVAVPDRPIWVYGDPTRIAQILHNLLINAAKYTPEGGRIEISTMQNNGFVDTSVSDNGRGLAPAQLESIFELFVQGDTSVAPHESGLGIGLTLARSLAERHGGTITAHSPGPGLGSTFLFRMPAGEASAEEREAQAREAPPRSRRIMVVDDNRDSADSMSVILRALGHYVCAAYDGPSSLQVARELCPEVVVLDLAMPGTSGFETLRLLRMQPGMHKSFVIAMTGFGAEEDRRRTRDAGFDAHLVKPIELDTLIRVLYEAGAGAA